MTSVLCARSWAAPGDLHAAAGRRPEELHGAEQVLGRIQPVGDHHRLPGHPVPQRRQWRCVLLSILTKPT